MAGKYLLDEATLRDGTVSSERIVFQRTNDNEYTAAVIRELYNLEPPSQTGNTMTTTDIDALRAEYLAMDPYPVDVLEPDQFSDNEINAIETYGNWLNAIWEGRVPLTTDKLKHFYLAKNKMFTPRTGIESLWFRYKQLETPF